ncbi:MAG TPA: ornithine carbamoyltransferase [Micropepsaceae bacterium]|nr:ornithine carbamoyltransferase [Micropepsaceae bacterium]
MSHSNHAAVRHFLDLDQFDAARLRSLIDDARSRKDARAHLSRGTEDGEQPLKGKMLALIFEKQSTRTRLSFDVAMRQAGGLTMVLNGYDLQLGHGETIADTARVISRYVDGIVLRTADHRKLEELARFATVPVINGLTDRTHPCQVMADIMTFEEKLGSIKGRRIAWVGSGTNVAASWIHAAKAFGFSMRMACPEGEGPSPALMQWARENDVDLIVGSDPNAAVDGADCILTDTWVSITEEDHMGAFQKDLRHNRLAPYRVTEKLMARAAKDAIFMHCLPAHRGEEVDASVIDGPRSAVWDEAENRLHAQKSILAWCMT